MRAVKTTTQNFLNKILELGISISLKNIPLEKRGLIGDIIPVLYTQVVKNVSFFQKLKLLIEKRFGNVPITVCVKTDVEKNKISLIGKVSYIKDENGKSYFITWNVKYWNLYIFLERDKNENIWLYPSRYIRVPIIIDMEIPQNINLETLKKRIHSGDFLIEEMADTINRFYYAGIKVNPVNIPAFFVEYLSNKNVISLEVVKDALQRMRNKNIEQIVSVLRDNADSFIEFLVFCCVKITKDKISVMFDTGSMCEWFLSVYEDVINSIVEKALEDIKSEMENKIEKMGLEELKRYNNRKVIYQELIEIRDSIDIPLDFTYEIEEFVEEDFYERNEIDERNLSDWLANYSRFLVYRFAEQINEGIGSGYYASYPFMGQIIKKSEMIKRVAKEMYNLLSETEVENDYLEFFETWGKNLFLDAFEKFLELYGEDKIIDILSPRIKKILDEEMGYVVKSVSKMVEEEILDRIRYEIEYDLIYEIQALIEELLEEHGDYEE